MAIWFLVTILEYLRYNTEIPPLPKQTSVIISMIIANLLLGVTTDSFQFLLFSILCNENWCLDEGITHFLKSSSQLYLVSSIYKSRKLRHVFINFLTKNIGINNTLYFYMTSLSTFTIILYVHVLSFSDL